MLPGERERADGDVFRTIRSNPEATFGFVLDAVGRPAQPGTSTPGEAAARAKLVNALSRVTAPGLRDRELRSFCDWIPIVAEFSFHPWQELLPADTRSQGAARDPRCS